MATKLKGEYKERDWPEGSSQTVLFVKTRHVKIKETGNEAGQTGQWGSCPEVSDIPALLSAAPGGSSGSEEHWQRQNINPGQDDIDPRWPRKPPDGAVHVELRETKHEAQRRWSHPARMNMARSAPEDESCSPRQKPGGNRGSAVDGRAKSRKGRDVGQP